MLRTDGFEPSAAYANGFTAHLPTNENRSLGEIFMILYNSSAAGSPTATLLRLNRN